MGKILADVLDAPFRDTDADVEAAAGKAVSEIFLDEGEDRFRELEQQAVATALREHDGVLALGGGAVLSDKTRALLSQATVAFLSVELAAAVARVGLGTGRPLLAVNPRASMRALLDKRRPLYAEVADVTVPTDDMSAKAVAQELARRLGEPAVVTVDGARAYDVVIGVDATMALPDQLAGATRAAVLYAPPLQAHARRIAQFLSADVAVTLIEVPDGEAAKTLSVAESCWERLGRDGFTRVDPIVGVGGGAVTDLAGFVAACWLRGVPVVQIPTSTLAMLDAAVGGKTAVNTASGKNLVGAFHPPKAVLCDLTVLDWLPAAERRAGLAEAVKCGFIADPAIVDLVESAPEAMTDPSSAAFAELIRRAVAVKAEVVSQDLHESGRRMILNYGHTFAHAVEHVENYAWRHGDAVAVGMVFAAELAQLTGRVDTTQRTRAVLQALGLPISYRGDRFDELAAAMRIDKKAVGDQLRFVLLNDVADPVVTAEVTVDQLRAAYERVST